MNRIFDYNSERLNGLDHLRAIAIILVMIFHFGRGIPVWLEPINKIGWTGVDLFFVLSGYLIGHQLLMEQKNTNEINFKHFYVKRFFRIIPAYFVVLILYYSLSNLREGSGMPSIWKFLTFTQNLTIDTKTQNSFSQAWSLCIEEQFYLLLPLIILTSFQLKIQKIAPYLILSLFVLGFILRYHNWNEYVQPFIENGNRKQMVVGFIEKVYYPSYNRMDGLIIGVGIAAILNYKPKLKTFLTQHGNLILLIGLGFFFLAYKVCDNFISRTTAIYGFPIISLAYGIIVIAAISPTCILYKIKTKISLVIATLSYAIYLTHKQLYHLTKIAIERLGFENSEQWKFWMCILTALIGSFLLHLCIEKPFLKLRRKILSNEKQLNNETSEKLILKYIKK